MSYDEDKALQKILDHLYKLALEHTYNNAAAEEIVRDTGLSLRAVKEQGNNAILHNWVIVDSRADDGEWIIRINQSGINKLKELENKKLEKPQIASTKKSKSKSPIRKIKFRYIVGGFTIIAAIIFIITSTEERIEPSTIENPELISEELGLEKCMTGEVGLNYKNCELGFEISRPNVNWIFVEELPDWMNAKGFSSINDPYFLGGVIVTTSERGNVLVVVFDDSDPTKKELVDFKNTQLQRMEEILEEFEVKSDNYIDQNSLWYELVGILNSEPFYVKQHLEKHGDKIYLIQNGYMLKEDELSPKKIEELNEIIESFNFIS